MEQSGVMIEFAKMHVTEALKAAAEKNQINQHYFKNNEQLTSTKTQKSFHHATMTYETNADSILTAYPLTNIK